MTRTATRLLDWTLYARDPEAKFSLYQEMEEELDGKLNLLVIESHRSEDGKVTLTGVVLEADDDEAEVIKSLRVGAVHVSLIDFNSKAQAEVQEPSILCLPDDCMCNSDCPCANCDESS